MNRSVVIPLVSLVIGLSLVGVIVFEWFEIENLRAKCDQLQEAYDQLVRYFFIKDSNFTISLADNPHWKVEAWHENPDSISEIEMKSCICFTMKPVGTGMAIVEYSKVYTQMADIRIIHYGLGEHQKRLTLANM